LPFLPGDAVKIVVGALIVKKGLKKGLKKGSESILKRGQPPNK